jgi:hypothetical protein
MKIAVIQMPYEDYRELPKSERVMGMLSYKGIPLADPRVPRKEQYVSGKVAVAASISEAAFVVLRLAEVDVQWREVKARTGRPIHA